MEQEHVIQIKKAMKKILGDSRHLGGLTGPAQASNRQEIMSVIHRSNIPKSKSGITALTKSLLLVSGVTGTCIADQEDKLITWIYSTEKEGS